MNGSIWGPLYTQYSQKSFEPQTSEVSQDQEDQFYDQHKVPHIGIIENWLCDYDPSCPDPTALGTRGTLETIGGYMLAANTPYVPKHYHGFLCIRYLLHSAALSYIERAEQLDEFFTSLPDEAEWTYECEAAAFTALDIIAEETRNTDSFEDFCRKEQQGAVLMMDIERGGMNGSLLIDVLWQDRSSLMALHSRGLLPGIAIMLYMAWNLPQATLYEERQDSAFLLQELILRICLVGSHRDRQILQPLLIYAVKISPPPRADRSVHFINSEDSAFIRRAYSGLVYVWQQSAPIIRVVNITLMTCLTELTMYTSLSDPATTIEEHIDMIGVAILLAWLILEHRGQVAQNEYAEIWLFCIITLRWLRFIDAQDDLTEAHWRKLAKMISESQLVGLLGRLILLPWTEGGGLEYATEFEIFLERINSFEEILGDAVAAAPDLFEELRLEWIKTASGLGIRSLLQPDMLHLSAMKASRTWEKYLTALPPPRLGAQLCSYPRCIRPHTRETATGRMPSGVSTLESHAISAEHFNNSAMLYS
ncbi:hypothetical protein RhiJN_23206 [Ceratobasidium sp. AG-Ba]|nr:hypothetical protein RhiJN_23206 [Ceratobasidium sp. AG-Ba]